MDALARSIEINDLSQTLDRIGNVSPATRVLDLAIEIDVGITGVFSRYNSHPFRSPDEQLRERLGFFLQESVRGVFRSIAKKMPSFCNDIYANLAVSYVTMDVFNEFCRTKSSMNYQRRDEDVWRVFVNDMQKICSNFHAWSREGEVSRFMDENGTTDDHLKNVLAELE